MQVNVKAKWKRYQFRVFGKQMHFIMLKCVESLFRVYSFPPKSKYVTEFSKSIVRFQNSRRALGILSTASNLSDLAKQMAIKTWLNWKQRG